MFKYGKKKQQGATRNTARQAASPSGHSSLPGWLLVGLGMGIGLFIAFMLFLWKPWQPVKRVVVPAANETPDTPPTSKDTSGPRFDFYRLLPSQKMVSAEPAGQTTAPTTTAAKPVAAKPDSIPAAAAPVTAKPAARTDADKQDADRKRAEAILEGKKQAVAEKPKADAPAKEKEKAAKETKEKEKDPDNSRFTLQAGSFKSQAEAERRKAKVAMQGLPARVQQVNVKEGQVWYRVIVGPFKGKSTSEKAQGTLRSDGIDSLMVKDKK